MYRGEGKGEINKLYRVGGWVGEEVGLYSKACRRSKDEGGRRSNRYG